MLWKLISNKYLILLLFTFIGIAVSAQDAQGLFNNAAQAYVSGNKSLAKQIALSALEKYPNDPKLSKLLGKMKDEENKNQDKKDQQDQENKDDQKNNQDQKNQDQNQDDQKNDQPKDNNDQKKEDQKQGEKPKPKPNEMSREDAERLLEALSKDEQDVQKKVNAEKIKGKPVKTEKDW